MKEFKEKQNYCDNSQGDQNHVLLRGWLEAPIRKDHENEEAAIYTTQIRVERIPGVVDVIPVFFKENKLVFLGMQPHVGDYMEMEGYFHSKDVYFESGKRRMENYVYVDKLSFSTEALPSVNEVYLVGEIFKCRKPRVARNGQHLIDFLIKVRRKTGKTSRVPCVVWGAYKVVKIENAGIGAKIELSGRIESREYIKIQDGEKTSRTLYEISVSAFKLKSE